VSKKHRTSLKVEKRDAVVPVRIDPTPERRYPSYASRGEVVTSLPLPVTAAYPLTVVEAAGVSAVRRCVSLIANAIAGQRWTEWEGEPATRLMETSRIVKRPAASMTRREWVWRVIASMALTDVQYIYMVGGVDDEGIPGSLLPLPKEAIQPAGMVDPWGIFPPSQYSISGINGTVSGEAVIPMRSAFWPGVPIHLQGILQMARNAMMMAHASDAYVARYWQSGGSPITQITTEQFLDDTQADAIGNRYRARRAKGPDYPLVLGQGATAQPWGADVSQQAAVEARREIVIEIANLFGVDAEYLNVTPTGSSMTYANIQDKALALDRFTLSGFYDPIQDIVSDLLPEERYMLIDMSRLTRAGQESRFRAWQIATGNKPWMMPAEVRTEEGLAPSPEIDAMEESRLKAIEAGAEGMAQNGQNGQDGQPQPGQQQEETVNA
jgi:HK97 family phage portal protein